MRIEPGQASIISAALVGTGVTVTACWYGAPVYRAVLKFGLPAGAITGLLTSIRKAPKTVTTTSDHKSAVGDTSKSATPTPDHRPVQEAGALQEGPIPTSGPLQTTAVAAEVEPPSSRKLLLGRIEWLIENGKGRVVAKVQEEDSNTDSWIALTASRLARWLKCLLCDYGSPISIPNERGMLVDAETTSKEAEEFIDELVAGMEEFVNKSGEKVMRPDNAWQLLARCYLPHQMPPQAPIEIGRRPEVEGPYCLSSALLITPRATLGDFVRTLVRCGIISP